MDTCHIFQAGYDLNDDDVIKKVHSIFEPVKEKIMLIHLNNSFYPFNSHIDRHEQLDKGYIKINKLIKFIYAYKDTPMILETVPPYEKQINFYVYLRNRNWDNYNLDYAWKMVDEPRLSNWNFIF